MIINKRFREITTKDLVLTDVFNDMDLDVLTKRAESGDNEAVKEIYDNLDKGNQILKETFVKQAIDRIVKEYKVINPDFNLITTDYFYGDVDLLSVVGSRTVEPGPEEVTDRDKHWYIEGFITYDEFKLFPDLYQEFKEQCGQYDVDNWDLELNVIGGIMAGNLAIPREELHDWRKEGVLIEPWGFDVNGNMTSFTELLVTTHEEFRKKAQSIREKGRIDSMEELQILMLDDEGEELFKSIFSY